MEMTIDKRNGDVCFNEEYHKYFNINDMNIQYTSVTTLIGMYHEHFDTDFWTSYKAAELILGDYFIESGLKKILLNKKVFSESYIEEYDIDSKRFVEAKETLRLQYETTNKEACEKGTRKHKVREDAMYSAADIRLNDYIPSNTCFTCKKDSYDLDVESGVFPEFLIYYSEVNESVLDDGPELHIAGQVDLVVKEGNHIHILDYKTNSKGISDKAYFDPKKKDFKRMFAPINDLHDHTLNHYALQLSIYAYMLQQKNPEFVIKSLKLIHIDDFDQETIIEVPYLREHVIKLLNHFKNNQYINKKKEELNYKFLDDVEA